MPEAKGFRSPRLASWASFNEQWDEMVGRCRRIAERERRYANHPRTTAEEREQWFASADEWDKRAEQYDALVVSYAYLRRLDDLEPE